MDWLQANDYSLARLVLQRALGAIYLVGFLVAVNQFRPLLGERGLLPAPRFLAAVPFRRAPSIFHVHYSDRFFSLVAWTGVVLAALVVAGAPDRWPPLATALVWLALWALYLSIVNVGQVFYAFGWEALLLEAGFLAVFLGPPTIAPPTLVLVALRWLLFRLELGAGLIKLRGDRCWRDLTCLDYHHETQPMPNPLSWFFHHLPRPVHRAEVLVNHFTQLVVPFGLFAPQPVAAVAGGLVVLTQAWLVLSGNFSWLNVTTMALAFVAFDDDVLGAVLSEPAVAGAPPAWHQAAAVALALVVAFLSYRPARNLASRRQRMNSSFDPLHLVNTYGAFGSVTRERYEVVLEGTLLDAAEAARTDGWREYEFKGKPGDPKRRPPQVAPYHLRLDWLMWFLALPGRFDDRWLVPLVVRLLENDRDTLALLRTNPFPDVPPAYVRAVVYRYRFSTRRERRETGAWWVRSFVAERLPPLRLHDERQRPRSAPRTDAA